jgi:hypothetical protein
MITIRCARKPIDPALLTPWSAGEIIAQSATIRDGEVQALSFQPFGELSIEGDAFRALPAVLAWVNNEAMVVGTGWSWADAISESLLRGLTVDVNALPAGVILARPNN